MVEKPNLLFLFTDEQRFDSMRCYGNASIRTPNLDRLADQSVVFENAYVTQPVCTPSRASIMTGLYPHTTGCTENNIPLRKETPTIAEMLSDDYVCAYHGKWHLGDEVIPQHGFGEWVSIEDGPYRAFYSRPEYLERLSNYHHFLVANGFEPDIENQGTRIFGRYMAARMPEEFTKAAFLGREAADFIRRNKDNPFLLYVNFLEPHMPFTGPFDDMYDPEQLPVGPTFLEKPESAASLYNRLMAEAWMHSTFEGHDLSSEAGWLKLRAQYWGLVTLVDRSVGRILSALHECGLDEKTIVVFTSDHGDMMGDHGILAKCVMYEEAVRAPLLVRIPWVSRGHRRIGGRISQIDLVPTLLDLIGEPIPEHLEGESRAAVLAGDATPADNDVFIEWNGPDGLDGALACTSAKLELSDEEIARVGGHPWRTVVTADGWKLNLSPADQCELYDLNADPFERKNLFGDASQAQRVGDLTGRVERWQEQVGDDVDLGVERGLTG